LQYLKKYNIYTPIYSKSKMLHLPSLPSYSQVKPIVKDVIKGVNALCPNPNVTVTLPNKITFGCR
jgi:hypothetical protein